MNIPAEDEARIATTGPYKGVRVVAGGQGATFSTEADAVEAKRLCDAAYRLGRRAVGRDLRNIIDGR